MRKNLGSVKTSVSKTRHKKTLVKPEHVDGELDLALDRLRCRSGELSQSFQSLSAIAPTPVEWIWDGVIPRGKLVLIAGTPGVGKSLVALQVAAMVTLGWRTPLIRSSKRGGQAPGQREQTGAPRTLGGGQTPFFARKEAGDPDGNEFVEGAAERVDSHDVDMKDVGDAEVAGDLAADDVACSVGQPGCVVLVTSDDDGVADTIRPRLQAAGADVARVLLFAGDRPVGDGLRSQSGADVDASADDLKDDVDHGAVWLARELERLEADLLALRNDGVDVPLVVIDSIDRYVNSAKNKREFFGIVSRLVQLAERSGAAVLVVANSSSMRIDGSCHPNGRFGMDQLIQAARAAFLIVPDLEGDDRRLMLPLKMNLSGSRTGKAFSIRDGVVEWLPKRVSLTVGEYFVHSMERLRNPLHVEETTELSRAVEYLKNTLSEGPISSVWTQCDARENGIGYGTLRRAYARLGCQSFRKPGTTRWFWKLPELITDYSTPSMPDRVAQEFVDAQHAQLDLDHEK